MLIFSSFLLEMSLNFFAAVLLDGCGHNLLMMKCSIRVVELC